jgi:hypothetical protein
MEVSSAYQDSFLYGISNREDFKTVLMLSCLLSTLNDGNLGEHLKHYTDRLVDVLSRDQPSLIWSPLRFTYSGHLTRLLQHLWKREPNAAERLCELLSGERGLTSAVDQLMVWVA